MKQNSPPPAPPPAPAPLLTVDEFWDGGSKYDHCELWDGALLVHDPAGGNHGVVASRVVSGLQRHVDGQGDAWVFAAETGFVLSKNPARVLAPDGACVLTDRLPKLTREGFVPLVPDFVLEVRSWCDSFHKVNEKAGLWIAHGARVVWAADPGSHVVVVHRASGETAEFRGAEAADAAPVFPDFRMTPDEIFRGLE